ncbi:hypothetical protein BDQ12DRAFT_712263 [Crucibulum laeve]|uniref:F-box domain-containing protein n=1 Tax=Crucibulum laeve TaxID=68775 RepID=A0A5C3M5E3_9AGAR|nr:hypothetical protein BDQ12DRAFT_712263 [Crucibulum laeve]
MITNILSLPNEVIEIICNELKGSRKCLRLLCTRFNEVLQPILFFHVTIDFQRPSTLRDLAANSELPMLIQHLDVKGILDRDTNMSDLFLSVVVPQLVNVRKVIGTFHEISSEYFLDCLANMQRLEDVTLEVIGHGGCIPNIKLSRLRPLQRISLSKIWERQSTLVLQDDISFLISLSPDLQCLELDSGIHHSEGMAPSFNDILDRINEEKLLQITRLRLQCFGVQWNKSITTRLFSLTSLTLLDIYPYAPVKNPMDEAEVLSPLHMNEALWKTLQLEGIILRELVTDEICEVFLDYIASYSGLIKLVLTRATAHNGDAVAADTLAETFYFQVLPLHADSLEILDIRGAYERKWCYGYHYSDSLRQCRRLNRTCLSIYPQDINQRVGEDAIWSLLEVAEKLPLLEHLYILQACPEEERGVLNYNWWNHRSSLVSDAIERSIRYAPKFTPPCPGFAVITQTHRFLASTYSLSKGMRRPWFQGFFASHFRFPALLHH